MSSSGSLRLPCTIPTKPRSCCRGAGYPRGFDAGDYYRDLSYSNIGEAVLDNLQAVGIRPKLGPIERAAFTQGYAEKTFKNIIRVPSAPSAAATRLEAQIVKGGYLFTETTRPRRALSAASGQAGPQEARGDPAQDAAAGLRADDLRPIWQLAFINGVGREWADQGSV